MTLEIFTLFAAAFYLIAAEIQIRFSKSETLLKKLHQRVPGPFLNSKKGPGTFCISRLRKLPTTRIVSLVEAVDRRLGWKPSCLRRTIALAQLGRGLGWTTEFKIGARREEGNLRAHSWLELDGMRLEMDDEAAGYSVLS